MPLFQKATYREAATICANRNRALREADDFDELLYRTMPIHSLMSTVNEMHSNLGGEPTYIVQVDFGMYVTTDLATVRTYLNDARDERCELAVVLVEIDTAGAQRFSHIPLEQVPA